MSLLNEAEEKVLRQDPNARIFRARHDNEFKAWEAGRVAEKMNDVCAKRMKMGADVADYDARVIIMASCPTIKAFADSHPKIFEMITDFEKMSTPKYRGAIDAMLSVRKKVDVGQVRDGEQASAIAISELSRILAVPPSSPER